MILGFESDYEVCNCKKITISDILDVIKKEDIQKLGQLQEFTFAGTECRNCLFEEADNSKLKKKIYCKDVLNYYKETHG